MRGTQMLGVQISVISEFDLDDLDAHRRHDVAIGRIARCCDRHAIADVEHGQECQVEGGRRAGRDGNALRRHLHAIMLGIVPRDRLAQAGEAKRIRVADFAVTQSTRRGLSHGSRRRIGRLANRHRHNVDALPLQAVRLRQHVHGMKRLDIAAS